MKRPGFFEGVLVALIAALLGSLFYSISTLLFAPETALRLLIVAVSLGYSFYLLSRSTLRTGRVTAMAGWSAITILTLSPLLPPTGGVLLHSGYIWLLRSRYLHANTLLAIMDLGLAALGVAVAGWATLQSGNLFLALWSFFIVQALFVFLPTISSPRNHNEQDGDDDFLQSYQSAQQALRKLHPDN